MITYEEALRLILKNTAELAAESVPIEASAGRILKEDVYSGIEMPPFDKSAVDGYALNSSALQKFPVKLKCIGLIQAGENFTKKIKLGECVKIMTGAPLPMTADSVVMVENSRQSGDRVEIFNSIKKGDNVCWQGEDLSAGQKVLSAGIKISSADVGLLATVGKRAVQVVRRPQAAVLNTGGEIIPAGVKLSRNKIYNSNGPMLVSLLAEDNFDVFSLGIARDEIKALKEAIAEGLKKDVLLVSGGVSVGDYDLVPKILENLGVKKIFHKVNIKPGRPLFFGQRKKTIVFGIPGNPVSNFLAYQIFIRPAFFKMIGEIQPDFKEGVISTDFTAKGGRKHFVLTGICRTGEGYRLTPLKSHGSADVLTLAKADGFMILEEKICRLKKGRKVPFLSWRTK